MASDVVPVVIVQLEGSPGCVYPSLDDAMAEVKALVATAIDEEGWSTRIQVRIGTMSLKAIEELGEFQGY